MFLLNTLFTEPVFEQPATLAGPGQAVFLILSVGAIFNSLQFLELRATLPGCHGDSIDVASPAMYSFAAAALYASLRVAEIVVHSPRELAERSSAAN